MMTMKADRTVAKIGRSMKKWGRRIGGSLFFRVRQVEAAFGGAHLAAGARPQQAADDDAVGGLQPFAADAQQGAAVGSGAHRLRHHGDRKSTRLNSSR